MALSGVEWRRVATREVSPAIKRAGDLVAFVAARLPALVDTAILSVTQTQDTLVAAQALYSECGR